MFSWTAVISSILYVGFCIIALLRGGRPERLVATAVLLVFAATLVLQDRTHLESAQLGIFGIDLGLLVAVLWAAFTSNRKWTLAAASFQCLTVLMHVSKLVDPRVDGWSYLTAVVIASDGVPVCLILGSLLEVRPASHRLQSRNA